MNNEKENVKDDVEPNTETTTVDFETWKTNLDICPPYVFNENDIKYIQEKMNIKGFMLTPIEVYDGKVLLGKTARCESLNDIIQNFKDKEIFICQLVSYSVILDSNENPKIYWKLKYATLEN